MQQILTTRLKAMTLGDPQSYKNIVIVPLMDGDGSAVDYITLGEALGSHQLMVAELDKDGSVPELKVENRSDRAVLLLDGEELAGAKQNRVLNTTILVPEQQSVVIPVSCTEQGRWSYSSDTFYESGTVMACSMRARKNRSVSESLEEQACYRSDQGEVWDSIASLQQDAGTDSATGAMRDVYESRQNALDAAMETFTTVSEQSGLLAIIGDQVVGFDLISKPDAYTRLHDKLVKSYVMDALVGRRRKTVGETSAAIEQAQKFLEVVTTCEETRFKSVGHGDDYRYKRDRIAGSALLYRDTVIHAAFFHLDTATPNARMAGYSRRRAYRDR
jgi:hypothetical protein